MRGKEIGGCMEGSSIWHTRKLRVSMNESGCHARRWTIVDHAEQNGRGNKGDSRVRPNGVVRI
jgi:hypothetical protein